MANSSATTTLGRLEANARARTKTESIQLSGITNLQMDEMAFEAGNIVVTKLKEFLVDFYKDTEVAVTESNNIIDLSGISISDATLSRMKLIDSVYGRIVIVNDIDFQDMQQLYTAAELANVAFATPVTVSGKSSLRTFRGSGVLTVGIQTFKYVRNMNKVTDPTGIFDMPDNYMPVVEDVLVTLIQKRLEQVPSNVMTEATSVIESEKELLQQEQLKQAKKN